MDPVSAAAPEPLHVLYLIADHTRMAGVNRCMVELIRNLPPWVVPHVVITAEGQVAQAFRSEGIQCEILEPGGAMNTFGGWLVTTSALTRLGIALRELVPFTVRLRRVIRRERIALVHVNEGRGSLLAAAAARLEGIPVVGQLHGEILYAGVGRWITEAVPSRIVAVSEGVRRTLSPRAQAKATTVHSGVSTASRATHPIPFLAELRARGVKIICCFATLTPFKGCHHLIDAVAELNERGWRDRIAVFWIGDIIEGQAEYNAWLARKIQQRGIDNFTFTGWRDSPFSFYPYCDVAVLPSVSEEDLVIDGRSHRVVGSEGFPVTNLEAMAFGVPVVASRISGVPEQVEDGVTGLLVAPGAAPALADTIEQLIRAPDTARAMGQAGARRVRERFSTGRFVEGMVRVYAAAVGAQLPPGAGTDG
jgi:glycosyltransferase involved in cell wall biosynthesis